MRIVLDTNIIESDPTLSSKRFQVLLGHTSGLRAKFSMPRIVWEELPAVRRRHLQDLYSKFRQIEKSLQMSLVKKVRLAAEIDIETAVHDYIDNIANKLGFDANNDIVEFKDGYLTEVIKRGINRIAPCSAAGEEIRDAVLWLTVLDVAEAELDKKVIFISNDSAFHGGHKILKSELHEEACLRHLDIEYHKDLSSFAEHYKLSAASLFITKDWILNNIPIKDIVTLANEDINSDLQDTISWNLSFRQRAYDLTPTGYLEEVSNTVGLETFFVNEIEEDAFRIEAQYTGQIEYEVEFEYYDEFKSHGPGRWRYNSSTDDLEFVAPDRSGRTVKSEMIYPVVSVELKVEILVKNGQIISLEIIEF